MYVMGSFGVFVMTSLSQLKRLAKLQIMWGPPVVVGNLRGNMLFTKLFKLHTWFLRPKKISSFVVDVRHTCDRPCH